MHLLTQYCLSVSLAELTVMVLSEICIPSSMPVVPISFLLLCTASMLIILGVGQLLMLFTVPFMRKPWTAWVGAGMLWSV